MEHPTAEPLDAASNMAGDQGLKSPTLSIFGIFATPQELINCMNHNYQYQHFYSSLPPSATNKGINALTP